ncbi:hypothetical protein vseg_014022 [Gypsophila vaccaria]
MLSCGVNVVMTIILIIVVLIISFDQIEAMRPLKEEQQKWLLLESLPKGPTKPSKANPCTNIPKSGGKGHCAFLSEMHFSGVTKTGNVAPATAFSSYVSGLEVAIIKEHDDIDNSLQHGV